MEKIGIEWTTVKYPGYLGGKKDEKYKEWNKEYGEGSWRLVWIINGRAVDFLGACALYEDGYFVFLRNHPDILMRLINDASEIYDNNKSNVKSGLDYQKQETSLGTHIQDIAIRRCLVRMGLGFKGRKLIQIRGDSDHPLGEILSPGSIPFHRPDLVLESKIKGWWNSGSVEEFYQSNRCLQVLEKQ